jgi:hypothetical protein
MTNLSGAEQQTTYRRRDAARSPMRGAFMAGTEGGTTEHGRQPLRL